MIEPEDVYTALRTFRDTVEAAARDLEAAILTDEPPPPTPDG